jgi:hypothetical protein
MSTTQIVRSLSQGDAHNVLLEDVISTIAINPEFSKGYLRKGAALHVLKRYNDVVAELKALLLGSPPASTKAACNCSGASGKKLIDRF